MNRNPFTLRFWMFALVLAALVPLRAQAQCTGDCNRNGKVTADEIVFGTNITFDASLLPQCPSFDSSGDEMVKSAEIVESVTFAVEGCPITPGCGNGCVDFDLGENCDDGGICRGGERNGERCNQPPSSACDSNPCPGGICVAVEGDDVGADPCPSNCRIASCNTASGTVDVNVTFNVPAGRDVTSATVFVRYPDGVVRIPGNGGGQTVQDRISVPSFANFTPNDLDYGLQILLFQFDGSAIPPPDLFTIQFDGCQGAAAPFSTQFDCVVLDATGTDLLPVEGVTCQARVAGN